MRRYRRAPCGAVCWGAAACVSNSDRAQAPVQPARSAAPPFSRRNPHNVSATEAGRGTQSEARGYAAQADWAPLTTMWGLPGAAHAKRPQPTHPFSSRPRAAREAPAMVLSLRWGPGEGARKCHAGSRPPFVAPLRAMGDVPPPKGRVGRGRPHSNGGVANGVPAPDFPQAGLPQPTRPAAEADAPGLPTLVVSFGEEASLEAQAASVASKIAELQSVHESLLSELAARSRVKQLSSELAAVTARCADLEAAAFKARASPQKRTPLSPGTPPVSQKAPPTHPSADPAGHPDRATSRGKRRSRRSRSGCGRRTRGATHCALCAPCCAPASCSL